MLLFIFLFAVRMQVSKNAPPIESHFSSMNYIQRHQKAFTRFLPWSLFTDGKTGKMSYYVNIVLYNSQHLCKRYFQLNMKQW